MRRQFLVGTMVALGGGFLSAPVGAYETAITDTTGYVVQSATDAWGESSFVNGAHFPGGAPVAGKDYLVNAARRHPLRWQEQHGDSHPVNDIKGDTK